MLAPSFVTNAAQTLYGFEPQAIESLDQYQIDWRGIYHVHDPQGRVWVMRLLRLPDQVDSLIHTTQQRYCR